MKTYNKQIVSFIACTIIMVLGTCFSIKAQIPEQSDLISQTITNTPMQSSWISFAQGVHTNKSLTLSVYPSYAPDLTIDGSKKSWGAGVAALYPLGDYAFTGARLDWLGDQFWSPSITIGVKASVQIFGYDFTSFALGGAILPLGGAGDKNHSVGAIAGGGIYTTIWQSNDSKTSVQAYYAVEHWTIFSGVIHHPGLALTLKF